jgi:hypothetical protein
MQRKRAERSNKNLRGIPVDEASPNFLGIGAVNPTKKRFGVRTGILLDSLEHSASVIRWKQGQARSRMRYPELAIRGKQSQEEFGTPHFIGAGKVRSSPPQPPPSLAVDSRVALQCVIEISYSVLDAVLESEYRQRDFADACGPLCP